MKKHKNKKRRNAGPPRAPSQPRASPRRPPEPPPLGLAEIGAIVVGGAATAGLDYLAKRASPTVSTVTTVALTTASLVGARVGEGAVRTASAGVLGACAGHIVGGVLPTQRNAANDNMLDEMSAFVARRQAALPAPKPGPKLRDAIARAQATVAVMYPDDGDAVERFAA